MAENRRYLRKMGEATIRLFGWTVALAAQPNMVECDKNGRRVFGENEEAPIEPVDVATAFTIGSELRTLGEKQLKDWIAVNVAKLNRMPLEVQIKVVDKWQKYFGAEPMPEGCTFMTSIKNVEADEEAIEEPPEE